jgi:hypothetical protein
MFPLFFSDYANIERKYTLVIIVTGIVQDIGKIVDESVIEAIEQLQELEIQDELPERATTRTAKT